MDLDLVHTTLSYAADLAQEPPPEDGFYFEVLGQRIRLLFFKRLFHVSYGHRFSQGADQAFAAGARAA